MPVSYTHLDVYKRQTVGTTYSTTAFTAAANTSPYTYTAAFPQMTGGTQNRTTPYAVTFTGTNSLSANQWVSISGCTTAAGLLLNRAIGQVASATSTSAVVAIPSAVTAGTYSDTCTLTTASVAIAFDGYAHFNQSVSNLEVAGGANPASVDFLFGSRVDTGTRIWNVWAESTGMYGYYFAQGGINVDFDKGWRADNACLLYTSAAHCAEPAQPAAARVARSFFTQAPMRWCRWETRLMRQILPAFIWTMLSSIRQLQRARLHRDSRLIARRSWTWKACTFWVTRIKLE